MASSLFTIAEAAFHAENSQFIRNYLEQTSWQQLRRQSVRWNNFHNNFVWSETQKFYYTIREMKMKVITKNFPNYIGMNRVWNFKIFRETKIYQRILRLCDIVLNRINQGWVDGRLRNYRKLYIFVWILDMMYN